MKGHGSKFPRKFEEAVVAYLSHRTIEESAVAVGISTKTLKNWMKQPEFAELKQKLLREMYDQARTLLVQKSTAASAVVLKMMAEPSVPPAVRLKASKIVLDLAGETIELKEMEQRISDLESNATKRKGKG